MTGRILIAYVSRKGSTAEIAQAVGKELESTGNTVEVAEMKKVSSLAGYNAIVIGAPLYMGRMVGDVGRFVGQHREELKRAGGSICCRDSSGIKRSRVS